MGCFSGHKMSISCLCAMSKNILASGSEDTTIKIWNTEVRSIMSTLSGHTNIISALCNVNKGVFVSGSGDYSLIIWSKLTLDTSTYSHKQTLTGHKSWIKGIIRLNNREIVSGEYNGDLRIWNIDQGLCIRHIPRVNWYGEDLNQMKQDIGGDVVIGYWDQVRVCGAANDWGNTPIKQFKNVCEGHAIEFLSGDLLIRGGFQGGLEFIDYGEIGCQVPPNIEWLHSQFINAIQSIAKNIVVTASDDGYLKVIHPISRICYLKFEARGSLEALAYFY